MCMYRYNYVPYIIEYMVKTEMLKRQRTTTNVFSDKGGIEQAQGTSEKVADKTNGLDPRTTQCH